MTESNLTRRDFIKSAGKYSAALCGVCAALSSPAWLKYLFDCSSDVYAADRLQELLKTAPLARYWVSTLSGKDHCFECHSADEIVAAPDHRHEEAVAKCLLCAQNCLIAPGERGRCHARINIDGELKSLVYGRPISIHIDPIEKKPFYHFLPGAEAFSLATSGCPLQCQFCQNWQISQIRPEDYEVAYTPPVDIVRSAETRRAPVIAFTYNEPTVFTEYLTDIAREARPQGIRSVLISCGFMNEEPLAEMCTVLDAIKIDLKGYSEDFYHKVCGAELAPVLRSIRQVAESGTHLEIVNLVVPTLNDSEYMLRELSKWVVGEIGPDVPVHFTRFHPDYRMLNLPPTPIATLERARNIALEEGMYYPFVGNVPGHPGNHTYCPDCGKIVIERQGFFVVGNHIKESLCEYCGREIAGVWE